MNSLRSFYRSRTTGSIDIHHTVRSHARLPIISPYATNQNSGISQLCNSKDHSSYQDLAGTLLASDSHRPLSPTPVAIPTNQDLRMAGIRTLGIIYIPRIPPTRLGLSRTLQMLPDSRANHKA